MTWEDLENGGQPDWLKEWQPVAVQDEDGIDFDKPIKGRYIARIVELTRQNGISSKIDNPYDFISLKLQVTEDVEGDKSYNRRLDKIYSLIDSQYATAKDNLDRLFNDLFTIGVFNKIVPKTKDVQGVLDIAPMIIDMPVKVTCYPSKSGKQAVKIVLEHKAPKQTKTESSVW